MKDEDQINTINEAEADATDATDATDASAAGRGNRRFTDDQITQIRELRAMKNEAGKAVHSHAALGKMFGVAPGVISQIVRNRTYIDKDYTPVNDGLGRMA